MPKIANKVINYSVYSRKDGRLAKINDTTEVKLPSVEMLTDTIKGAGILGEVDWPAYYQPGSMSTEISMRATNEELALLVEANDLEIRWVTDVFDTANVKTGINAHKAFIKCIAKKIDEGKIAAGEASEGSFEYEVFAYKRTVNGKEVLNIDKFNGIFAVNGIDLMQNVQAAL